MKLRAVELKDQYAWETPKAQTNSLKVYRSPLVGGKDIAIWIAPHAGTQVITNVDALVDFACELLKLAHEIEDERARFFA